MTTKNKKSLTEAAADVLASSIAATRPKEMTFGGGTTLNPAGVHAHKVDLGEPVQRTNQKFPNYTSGTPTATPPGATPPVGSAPMPKLPTQPQCTEGGGDNKDPTGPISYNIDTYKNRIKNKPDSIHPGQGNVCPPWARMESVEELTDDEFQMILEKFKGKDKKDMKFNFFDKKKNMSKDHFDKMKEQLQLTDEDATSLFENEELVNVPSPQEKLAQIVADAIAEQKQDFSVDVNAMFEGQDLSEDFKTKASTIFETAVATQVKTITGKIQEESLNILDEAVEQISEEMIDSIDHYVSYMVQEWIAENEIAIEKGLKSEIVEDFIAGLRNLFIENYIDIPEEKVDMVSELTNKVAELEQMVNEATEKNIQYKEEIDNGKKITVIESVCTGLAETQKAKIRSLAESVSFDNEKTFTDKIAQLKESYFPENKIVKPGADNLNTDQLILENENKNDSPAITDPVMQRIYDTLSRTTKR